MQLIGADDVLGALGDVAILGRQQFRTDGRGKNVEQHVPQLAFTAAGFIGRQVAHQRLGDGAVDRVHRHVVAVIGRPAQCKLGKIARAHDEAAAFIGQIHQHLRPLARLAVFIGHVVNVHILPDVGKVLRDRGCDVHLAQRHAIGFRELDRVALGALCRAEAGHCHGQDALAVESQTVKGVHHYDQCQRGIQTSGQADDGALAVRVTQTGTQPLRLKGEDFFTALRKVFTRLRHKGRWGEGAAQCKFVRHEIERDARGTAGLGIGRGAAAFRGQAG